MSIDLSSYLEVFADESREHLQNLNAALLEFERDTSNLDNVSVIFRSAHTLKGMSATMGFSEVAELTHKMENLLTPVRTGELAAGEEVVEVLFGCLDALQEMLEAHIAGGSHSVEISGLVAQLEALQSGAGAAPALKAAQAAAPPAPAQSGYPGKLSDDQIRLAAEAARAGQGILHVAVALAADCEMRGVRGYMALRALTEKGRLIACEPPEEKIVSGDPGYRLHFVLASAELPSTVRGHLEAISEVAGVSVEPLGSEAPPGAAPAPDAPGGGGFELNDYLQTLVGHARADGFTLLEIKVQLSADCTLKSARAFMVHKAIEGHGEILAMLPSVEDIEFERFERDLAFLLVTKDSAADVEADISKVSELSAVQAAPFAAPAAPAAAPQAAAGGAPQSNDRPAQAALARTGAGPKEEGAPRAARQSQTIRVDTERLDLLLNMVGELVIGKTRLTQLAREVKRADLSDSIEHFGHIVTDLQNIVMQTRMVPIETVFNRFPRMIRDLAKQRGKQIELQMTGGETELDRTVVDEIGDPLVHLIRNSLDHGIEPPDERGAAGKAPVGTLTLAAFHEGSHVFIQIRDDGRGIDPEKIKAIALKKGVITPERAAGMSAEEAVMLIFAAGFSTAEQVTDISGRGVGMDVVRTKIESLNGEVKVDTQIGSGTTVTIKLPLTLAIVQALLVEVAEETLAIPLAYIEETLRLKPKDIQKVSQQDVILLRGDIVPLVWARRILSAGEREGGAEGWRAVVVRTGRGRLGLIVDRTLGQTEIVIKSLGHYLSNTRYISGGTILGDGTVALILDVMQVGS